MLLFEVNEKTDETQDFYNIDCVNVSVGNLVDVILYL